MVLGDPCSDSPNGVEVALGMLGVSSCEVGGALVQASWVGEGWLGTRCVWEGVTSVLTADCSTVGYSRKCRHV